MDRTTLENAIHKILLAKGCSIWGRPFSIAQKKDRDKAVDWLIDTIMEPLAMEFELIRKEALTKIENPNDVIKNHLAENLDIARGLPFPPSPDQDYEPVAREAPTGPQEPPTPPDNPTAALWFFDGRQSPTDGYRCSESGQNVIF